MIHFLVFYAAMFFCEHFSHACKTTGKGSGRTCKRHHVNACEAWGTFSVFPLSRLYIQRHVSQIFINHIMLRQLTRDCHIYLDINYWQDKGRIILKQHHVAFIFSHLSTIFLLGTSISNPNSLLWYAFTFLVCKHACNYIIHWIPLLIFKAIFSFDYFKTAQVFLGLSFKLLIQLPT